MYNEYNIRCSVYEKATKRYGLTTQMIAALEELSELKVEICKLLNKKRSVDNSKDRFMLIDEIADSFISLEQLIFNFKLEVEVINRIDVKVGEFDRKLNSKK